MRTARHQVDSIAAAAAACSSSTIQHTQLIDYAEEYAEDASHRHINAPRKQKAKEKQTKTKLFVWFSAIITGACKGRSPELFTSPLTSTSTHHTSGRLLSGAAHASQHSQYRSHDH